jgi:hypothetical protein
MQKNSSPLKEKSPSLNGEGSFIFNVHPDSNLMAKHVVFTNFLASLMKRCIKIVIVWRVDSYCDPYSTT